MRCGPSSSVGIVTGYGLDGLGVESRWGARFFRTSPGRAWDPPSLLYNGNRVFPGGKERPGRDADPSPFVVPWSPYGPYGLYRASLPVQGVYFTCTFSHEIFFSFLADIYLFHVALFN
jgi:hypothetical protein